MSCKLGYVFTYDLHIVKMKNYNRFEHYEEVEGEYFCRYPNCNYTEGFKNIQNCKNHQLLLHAQVLNVRPISNRK